MPAQPVHTEEQVLSALRKEKGLVSKAAKRLKVTRETVHRYAREYPCVRQMIDEYRASLRDDREALLDLCESELHDLIEAGDRKALFFALNKLGWGRGYGEPRPGSLPEGYAVESWSVTVVNRAPGGELIEEAQILSSRALTSGNTVSPSALIVRGDS